MKRRFSPKRWPTRHRGRLGLISATQVLKQLWRTDGMQYPAWAKLAYARGWMTARAYYSLPDREMVRGPRPHEVMPPMYALVRKAGAR